MTHPRDLVKPKWRGLLHAYAAAVSVISGTALVASCRTTSGREAAAAYAVAVFALFATSAVYHRVTWQDIRTRARMKRADHAMIFLLIAGTYTPFATLVLGGGTRVWVLWVVWGGAIAGITARMLWLGAPRWAIVPLYLGLGWVAVFVFPALLHRAGVAPVVLLSIGGLAYSLGAVAYATRKPEPLPGVFGYHEVFHLATLVASVSHYAAVALALRAVGAI